MPSDNSSTRKKRRIVHGPLPGGAQYWDELRTLGLDAGLHAMGVTTAEPLLRARRNIEHRIHNNLVNDMQFTFRNPERSTTPSLTVEGARSIIVGAYPYFHGEFELALAEEPGYVARYAWLNHQDALKESLRAVMRRLRDDGHRAVVFADDNSVVDREVAYNAGIGWYGKNANILIPSAGSFFVLGCVVTTAELPVSTPVEDSCGTCTRCMPACPTDAIVAPGVIDAKKCLSWLLQKPGIFPREHREALGNRIYGCDDCQTSCPHTRNLSEPMGVPVGQSLNMVVGIRSLLTASDDEVMAQCDGWYVHDRNPLWIRRNALIIAGNSAVPSQQWAEIIASYVTSPEPILRAHAVWAAARLGFTSMIPVTDDDEMVRAELAHLPTLRNGL